MEKDLRKIMIISLTTLGYEGITSVIYNYCKHMDLENLELDFVAINEVDSVIEQRFSQLGKIHSIPNRKRHFLKYIKNLNDIMKKDYDVIHVHGNSATMTVELLLARLRGIKTRIAHCHNTDCTHKKLHKLLSPVFRKCYTHAFACSQSAGAWIYGAGRFTVLKNAIDLEKYRFDHEIRKKYRRHFQCNENTFAVGHIGHFSEQKNHFFLLEIFKQIYDEEKDSKLILIGDGLLRTAIEKKILDLGLEESVILLGKVDNVHEILQALNVIILPSRWEGLPLSLVEAQASGLPCFTSKEVTEEADFTGLVHFISLEKSAKTWKKKIMQKQYLNLSRDSDVWIKNIRERGYDIKKEAKVLQEMYEYKKAVSEKREVIDERLKVSLITIHGFRNYGSVLQTYATQEKFKQLGAHIEVVNYIREDSKDSNFSNWLIKKTIGSSKNIIKKLLYKIIINISIKKFASICDCFLEKNINLSGEAFFQFSGIKENIRPANIYCTGSDQVWNIDANNGILPAYYLEYAPKNKKCISYASSFGVPQFTNMQLEEMQPLFSKYSHLSVREHYGIKLLNQMGFQAEFVLDPTLAVEKTFWSKLFIKNSIRKKYILVYQLYSNHEMDKYIYKIQKIKNLPVIRIGTRYDHMLRNGKTLCFPTVEEWLTLFNDAEFILTDSFHGVAFSINFNKQFLCFSPKTFSARVIDILETFSLESQMVFDYKDFDKIEKPIYYRELNKKLEALRKKTEKYLANALAD